MPSATKEDRLEAPTSDPYRSEVEGLYEALRRGKIKLVGPSGEARLLPASLRSFLIELTGLLDKAKFVTVVRNQAQFTTVEAAALLGVSRQFLVNLLEKGEIPHHLVGTHRRVYAQDLFQYKAKRDADRHKAISELAQAEAREGVYAIEPSAPAED